MLVIVSVCRWQQQGRYSGRRELGIYHRFKKKNIVLYLSFSIGDWDDCCIDWPEFAPDLEGHLIFDFIFHPMRDRLVFVRLTAS